jgi:hypothetical protein
VRFLALLLLTASATPGARAASPFRPLFDLDALPILDTDVTTLQVASTDPTGGNGDAGHFVRVDGRTKVLADLNGPGVVRRIWSANPSGRLRVFIDGSDEPAVDAPFADVLEGKVPGFRPPVAGRTSGGWTSYVPIPFQRSCLITVTDGGWFYYQISWQRLPVDSVVPSFTGEWTGEDRVAYDEAVAAWSALGRNPAPRTRAVALPSRGINLPPKGRWVQPIVGPGTVTEIRFRFGKTAVFSALRQTLLRIWFDDEKTPSVEAPLGDFFGAGFDGVKYKSLAMGFEDNNAWCYFRMPFRKRARIELENTGSRPVTAMFSGAASPSLPRGKWGYFHATWARSINSPGQDYRFARLSGAGKIVGVTHSMRGTGSQWFLEGDERVFRDGDTIADILGTGTEDFYNCGWYFNTGPVSAATHGCGYKTPNEIMAYRFLYPDPYVFSTGIDFRIEHGGGNDAPGTEYSSVTYWYGAAGAKSLMPRPETGASLLPKPYVPPVPNAIEAEAAKWRVEGGGSIKTQLWQSISPYRGGGRALLLGSAGAEATTDVTVRFTDNYDIELFLSGANTGSVARLLVDGQPVGEAIRDGTGPLPVRKVGVGPVFLAEGEHTIGLLLESGAKIGLDAFRLSARTPLVRDFVVVGPFPVNPREGVNTSLPPDGKAPSLRAMFPVQGGRLVGWAVMQAPNGYLDLGSALRPNENVVAYAGFAVYSPESTGADLLVGSDDGVKVYVNGKAVFTNRVDRGYVADQDKVPIELKSGWNSIVIKVDQSGADWSLSARIPNPEGRFRFAALPPTD